MTKLTLQDREDIIALRQSGVTIAEVANKYGVCSNTVINITNSVKKGETSDRKARRTLTESEISDIMRDLNGEYTTEQLCEKYDVSANVIYRLKRNKSEEEARLNEVLGPLTEQFDAELKSLNENNIMYDVDTALLSESSKKLIDAFAARRRMLFEKYKEYHIELLGYLADMNDINKVVEAELEEKYRQLQSLFGKKAA